MQLLIDNICRPAPNITHLLLRFDVNGPIERTVLKPKSHYRLTSCCVITCSDVICLMNWLSLYCSCLKIILDNLEKVTKPDINALLHEFSFQVCFLSLAEVRSSYFTFFCTKFICLVWIQLLYELCLDPLTCGPVMDLLSTTKYQFFSKVHIPCFFFFCWLNIAKHLNLKSYFSVFTDISMWKPLLFHHFPKGTLIKLFASALSIRY
jgi:nuclear pore complex protein Nup205